MIYSVLNESRAIAVNIEIMRTVDRKRGRQVTDSEVERELTR